MTQSSSYVASRLTKGTATLDEVLTLLRHWSADDSLATFQQRVLANAILTKQTARRTKDIVAFFHAWLLSPDDCPARVLKQLETYYVDRRILRELLFLFQCRSEAVLYDFTRYAYWTAAHQGALLLRIDEIERFLQNAQDQGRAAKGWSAETQTRLAQGIMRALTNIGLLYEKSPYRREIVSYHVSDFTVAYLAYDLHLTGHSDGLLIEHPDWSLFGFDRARLLARLSELSETAGMIVQHAGSVVRITWLYPSWEALIDATFSR